MSTHNSPQGPEDHARLAEDFPSPSAAMHMDMTAELERQAAAAETTDAIEAADIDQQQSLLDHHHHQELEAHLHNSHQDDTDHDHPSPIPLQAGRSRSLQLNSFYTPTPQAPNNSHVPANRQLEIMREYYARNPQPSRAELDMLAEKTGRTWRKVREYFRQRRNKGRGMAELDGMAEPARATGWLQMTYRTSDPSSSQSQLGLYSAYRNRFDPYNTHTPLMSGQELIQLAIATFPGCEMARDEGEYVLRGVDKRDIDRDQAGDGEDAEGGEGKGIDGLVEPVRASTWLLNNFQPSSPTSTPATLTQTDLYTAYATRFSFTPPPATSTSQLPSDQAALDGTTPDEYIEGRPAIVVHRLLDPVELITLTRMTFPDCEPVVDEQGRFVVRGITRREGVRREEEIGEMFPFAAMSAPNPSSPNHPLTALLKRKLAQLHPDSDDPESDSSAGVVPRKRHRSQVQNGGEDDDEEISVEDRKLIEGLKRFRGSKLGSEVRDVCVSQ